MSPNYKGGGEIKIPLSRGPSPIPGCCHDYLYAKIKMLMKKEIKPLLHTQRGDVGFNRECMRALKNLKAALKSKCRIDVMACRAAYRKAQVTAKKEWEDSLWEDLILALGTKDSKRFWSTVSKRIMPNTRQLACHIQPGKWVTYFSGLYKDGNK